MTRTTMMTVFAAAAMTVAAHAQEMKANVPFDFSVAGTRMASGAYTVKQHSDTSPTKSYVLRNASTKKAIIAITSASLNHAESGNAKLVFRCWSSGCALAEVHQPGVWPRQFPTRAPKSGEGERAVAVHLTASTGSAGF
ncbi:MAG: hypothetical protein HY820_24530 [Acidobacteria bacterium]|nr:hypothetical protein [Acidobacteriota bacterium]